MLPRKRKREKMGVREPTVIRSPSHLQYCRSFQCAVAHSMTCEGPVQAAHVRVGTGGGTGIKPGDEWVVPLCAMHHLEQHQHGHLTFERKYNVDLRSMAEELWRRSPHRRKHEQ